MTRLEHELLLTTARILRVRLLEEAAQARMLGAEPAAAVLDEIEYMNRALAPFDPAPGVAQNECWAPPPVDCNAQVLTTGGPVPEDRSHTEIDPATGQQKGYIVLSPEERAKGFKRPVRRTYIHTRCGRSTSMGQALAETYARDPEFYDGTMCVNCHAHFPVGADGEFVWEDGSKVGT
jgi:hypothetical protein